MRGVLASELVNFFGHAWVAAWFSASEAFALGAMLPDFASVLGVAPPTSSDPELSAGIDLHHQTDHVFHETHVFQGLEQRARSALAGVGVSKGARRALAHVGVEFLIDAELVRRAPGWRGFTLALRYGSSERCGAELTWRQRAPGDTSQRLSRLCSRLAAAEPSSEPTRIASRLVAALSSRPRLRLQAEEVPFVEAWLEECAPEVQGSLDELLAELAHGLGAARGTPPAPGTAC
ncbi:MAG: hypothetical protein RL685_4827 [Pseudomonadota bacterium]